MIILNKKQTFSILTTYFVDHFVDKLNFLFMFLKK